MLWHSLARLRVSKSKVITMNVCCMPVVMVCIRAATESGALLMLTAWLSWLCYHAIILAVYNIALGSNTVLLADVACKRKAMSLGFL